MEKWLEGIQEYEFRGDCYCKVLDVIKAVREEIWKNREEQNCEVLHHALSRIEARLILGNGVGKVKHIT